MWNEYLAKVARLFERTRLLAATGEPAKAAIILTVWALLTLLCVVIVVLTVAQWLP